MHQIKMHEKHLLISSLNIYKKTKKLTSVFVCTHMNVEPFIILFMLIKHKKLVLKLKCTMRNLILFIFLTFFFLCGSLCNTVYFLASQKKEKFKTETCVCIGLPNEMCRIISSSAFDECNTMVICRINEMHTTFGVNTENFHFVHNFF